MLACGQSSKCRLGEVARVAAHVDTMDVVPIQECGEIGEAVRDEVRLGEALAAIFVVAEDADDAGIAQRVAEVGCRQRSLAADGGDDTLRRRAVPAGGASTQPRSSPESAAISWYRLSRSSSL